MKELTKQCKFIKGAGSRCRAYAITGSDYCFSHSPDPDVKDAKHRAVVRGGSSETYKKVDLGLNPMYIKEPNDLVIFLNQVISGTATGKIPPKLASCLGFLTGQLIRAMEITSIEGRLKAIEEVVVRRTYERGL